nr:MAG TPA: hypothetical protein [Caudoviricetes sp.]
MYITVKKLYIFVHIFIKLKIYAYKETPYFKGFLVLRKNFNKIYLSCNHYNKYLQVKKISFKYLFLLLTLIFSIIQNYPLHFINFTLYFKVLKN